LLWGSWAALILALLAVGMLVVRFSGLPVAPQEGVEVSGVPRVPPVTTNQQRVVSAGQGTVFHAVGDPVRSVVSFDQYLRLAGTFGLGSDGVAEEREAIIEVLESGRQEIVGVGETVAGIRVLAVLTDHVVLRGPNGRGDLYLGTYDSEAGTGESSNAGQGGDGSSADGTMTENRFGKQVSTNMWVFSRESVEAYYTELMEDPDRLLAVFDSLKPLRDEERRITGYQLGIEGEKDFFTQVGMREGDVVRRVNGIPMTNRRRAEYLIRRFAENKTNAFALDIERDGKKQRLVYSLR
jgi:type II secretion system protein C